MAAYATQLDFETHFGSAWTTTDAAELNRQLERATDDIDWHLGPWSVEANGRKLGAPAGANEKGLSASQIAALRNATVAQAYYLIRRGPSFRYDDQYQSTSGPDFSTTGQLARVSPAAKAYLTGTGLVIRAARVA